MTELQQEQLCIFYSEPNICKHNPYSVDKGYVLVCCKKVQEYKNCYFYIKANLEAVENGL
ncbi:MAG: hypothetical protein HQK91_13945 [Nitrospirae bacterium]|nr:hypothetical protein [Nitrospirota bacterium]